MAFSCRISPTIPVTDIPRARKFYEEKLGLIPQTASSSAVMYDCGGGTIIFLYKGRASKAKHVVAAFEVENIEATTKRLQSKGVVFEQRDTPGIDTVANVATIGTGKSAWFKDSEGNILALVQLGMMLELQEQARPWL